MAKGRDSIECREIVS